METFDYSPIHTYTSVDIEAETTQQLESCSSSSSFSTSQQLFQSIYQCLPKTTKVTLAMLPPSSTSSVVNDRHRHSEIINTITSINLMKEYQDLSILFDRDSVHKCLCNNNTLLQQLDYGSSENHSANVDRLVALFISNITISDRFHYNSLLHSNHYHHTAWSISESCISGLIPYPSLHFMTPSIIVTRRNLNNNSIAEMIGDTIQYSKLCSNTMYESNFKAGGYEIYARQLLVRMKKKILREQQTDKEIAQAEETNKSLVKTINQSVSKVKQEMAMVEWMPSSVKIALTNYYYPMKFEQEEQQEQQEKKVTKAIEEQEFVEEEDSLLHVTSIANHTAVLQPFKRYELEYYNNSKQCVSDKSEQLQEMIEEFAALNLDYYEVSVEQSDSPFGQGQP